MSLLWHSLSGQIHPWIEEAVASLRFSSMTPVQASTIPLFCGNKDVVVESVTGSGKTLSFVIPVLHHVSNFLHGDLAGKNDPEPAKKGHVLAVVITPTRELASQIQKVFDELLQFLPEKLVRISTQLVVGSLSSVREDLETLLKQKSLIVIATPGRLADLLKSTKVHTNSVQIAVLDEADKLLDMSFEAEVVSILKQLSGQRRTGLYSATLSAAGDKIFRTGIKNPVKICVQTKAKKQTSAPKALTIQYALTKPQKKLTALLSLLQDYRFKKCIVYFPTCTSVKHFHDFVHSLDLPLQFYSLHGQLNTNVRLKTLQKFDAGDNASRHILFTTDVAARGIDVPDVDLVVQTDPPSDPDMFLHRCGRTGRANKVGRAIVFLNEGTPEEDYVDFMDVKRVHMSAFELPQDAQLHQQVQQKLEQFVRKDRARHELAIKAYVGFVRHYQKHVASSIFRMLALDYLGLARLYGLLRLPKMPETKYIPSEQFPENGWLVEPFDMDKFAYANQNREKLRVENLAAEKEKMVRDAKKRKLLRQKNEAWSAKTESKDLRAERKEKNKRKREAIEREIAAELSNEEDDQIDWKDIVRNSKKPRAEVLGNFDGL